MVRLNLLLLAVLTACALGMVTAQHNARKLFVQLQDEQERARALEVEYGQLQLEASTWAMHTRVERIARQSLRMRQPDATRIQVVQREAPAPGATPGTTPGTNPGTKPGAAAGTGAGAAQ
jgi:cell division protein FtsL